MDSFIENDNEFIGSFDNETIEYRRVNFYDPTTIMEYASEILTRIDELKDSYSTMDNDYEIDYDMQEKIKNIDFIKRIEENEKIKKEEKKKRELLNSNFLMRGLNSLFNLEEKIESKAKTYGDLYRAFVGNVAYIRSDIVERKNNNIKNVNRTKAFLAVFEKYVSILEEAINVGYQDIEIFESSVIVELEKDENNISTLRTLKANIAFFKNVLVQLKECLNTYQSEIGEFEAVNRGSMEVAFEQGAFVRRYMSSVRGQGSLIIETKRQKDDIDQLDGIKKIINSTIEDNARLIASNVERINSLTVENFIEDKTFKTVNTMLQKCVELIVSTDKNREKILEKRSKELDEMSANLKKYRASIKLLGSPIATETLPPVINPDNSINDDKDLDEGYQKRLKR